MMKSKPGVVVMVEDTRWIECPDCFGLGIMNRDKAIALARQRAKDADFDADNRSDWPVR